jgi:hypothetical protein
MEKCCVPGSKPAVNSSPKQSARPVSSVVQVCHVAPLC